MPCVVARSELAGQDRIVGAERSASGVGVETISTRFQAGPVGVRRVGGGARLGAVESSSGGTTRGTGSGGGIGVAGEGVAGRGVAGRKGVTSVGSGTRVLRATNLAGRSLVMLAGDLGHLGKIARLGGRAKAEDG